jgi:hypothetical protein
VLELPESSLEISGAVKLNVRVTQPINKGVEMSYEIGDELVDGMSDCCSASVIDPSGEAIEGVCSACKEHCGIIKEG